jgi:hypothetical protein
MDSSITLDGGFDAENVPDSNLLDGGSLPDGDFLDIGSIDAEILPDSNINPDSGFNPDSGVSDSGYDAGKPDAGWDAGIQDAGPDAGAKTWYSASYDTTFQIFPIVGDFNNYSAGTACHNLGPEWDIPTIELLKGIIVNCPGMTSQCKIATNYCDKFDCNDYWLTGCNTCPSFKDRQIEGSYLNPNLKYIDLPVWSSFIYLDPQGWKVNATIKYDTALFEFKPRGVIPSAIYCVKKGK